MSAIDVTQAATDAYNAQLADRFETYSWGNANCNSYYRTETGHAPFLYPGGFKDYNAQHERCTLEDFRAA